MAVPALTRATITTCATLLAAAAPAAAKNKTHRGVDGCIAWSWTEGGFATTTMHYSNRCDTMR
ncbi:hypothetical protein [Streptomyces sp. NPDC002133]|uniref:hypothetical protein n=1 Tax=Streptomyces sp. NPDC002133 TaxID=3154409 RepID=UPI00332F31C3